MSNKNTFFPQNIDQALRKQTWYTSLAYTTYFLFGIMRGFPAFLLTQLQSTGSVIPVNSPSEVSWIASLSIFPNPFGSILAGYLMDKYGRKITIQLSMLVFTAGWVLITFSYNLLMLCIGNVIVGLAIGMGSCSTIYVAEICEVRNRCMLLSLLEIYFSLGIMVAYVATCYLKWNIAALIFCIFSALSLFLLYWIPESPFWLIKKNRINEALKCFKKFRCDNKEEETNHEFKILMLSIESEENTRNGLAAVIENIKPLCILVIFHVLLQGTGYTILLTYQSSFLKKFTINLNIEVVGIGYSILSFVASFITPFSVNYWRRKEVVVLSGVGMSVSLITLVFCNLFAENGLFNEILLYVIPFFLYLYVSSSTIGVLTLSQAMIGELYPTDVRGVMCGITEAIGTILSGFSVKVYPLIKDFLNQTDILFFFTFFGILTILFGKFILPETYGKSLSEIQNEYFPKKNKTSGNTVRSIKDTEGQT